MNLHMDHQHIVARLVEILTPLAEGRVPHIDEATGLTSELALDSMAVMNMVMAAEDAFDIALPVNMLAEVKTVGDLATQIEKRLG